AGLGAVIAIGAAKRGAKIAAAAAPYGKLDALVNNAGTTKHVPKHADLDGRSKEDFLRIFATNTGGAIANGAGLPQPAGSVRSKQRADDLLDRRRDGRWILGPTPHRRARSTP